MLKKKIELQYRKSNIKAEGSRFRRCKYCKHRRLIELYTIGGNPMGHGYRCEIMGLENSRRYVVEDDHVCNGWGSWGLGKHHPDRVTKGKNTRCVSPVNGEDNALHRNAVIMVKVGPKRAGCLLDGKEYKDLPWRLK